jgi:dipeptidase E
MKSPPRILLISNSTVYGRGYLDHVEDEIRNFLGPPKTVLFFPYALFDRDGYAAKAKTRFDAMGYSLESAHRAKDPNDAIERTDAIFIGGGNTFRLLKALQDLELLEPIRRKTMAEKQWAARLTLAAARARMSPDQRSRRLKTCRSCNRDRSTR